MKSWERFLLVASPRLPDPNFYRTVVLLIQHDEEGAFGLILNRLSENTVGEIWTMLDGAPCEIDQRVHFGGPVEGPLLALHTYEECSEREVVPGVYFATHKDHLNRIVNSPTHEFRVYNGYSGWAPGQLEQEMKVGGWMTLPARSEYVFADATDMWKRVAQEIGENVTRPLLPHLGVPGDPGLN